MEFVFTKPADFSFKPGQYLEWTLPHKNADSRGNRRYFTIASSPTEETLRLGVKFYPKGSSFKRALQGISAKTVISAGQLGGDFTLSGDTDRKLAFIAGGIGVTPYRSMVKYLLDQGEKRDAVLLYGEKNKQELAFTDLFEKAKKVGLKTSYALSDSGVKIDAELIKSEIPDFKERLFYISGPHGMVVAIRGQLKLLGVPNRQIKTDFFPGYA